jgi:retrotransposon gag protein
MEPDSQNIPQSETPAWVQEVIQKMQQVVERQDTQLQQQSIRIQDLEQQLQQQRARTDVLAPPLGREVPIATPNTDASGSPNPLPAYQPIGHEVVRGEQLPKPPEFAGKRSEFRSWLTQMYAKLTTDKAHESESVRFWYIHSRLRGIALTQVEPWVNAVHQNNQHSVDGLVEQLRAAYDDAQTAERASSKLTVMRQGNKSFAVFLAEFDRTILEAGGLTWADQVKRTFLNNCLSKELKAALVPVTTPAAYRDYCSLLHTVSSKLEALQKDDKHRTTPQFTIPETVPAPDIMDWAPTPIQVATARTRQAQWVEKDVIQKRREEGRCLRCGEDGHFVAGCPLLPAAPPKGIRTKPKKVGVKAVRLEEDPYESEDLGKE